MKMTSVTLTPVSTRRETGQISQHVIVQLGTDEELVGLGEMSDVHDWGVMYDLEDIKGAYESIVMGQDPLDWNLLTERARGRLRMGGAIRAGLEIAIFDLIGKIQGRSVAGVFGGAFTDKMRVCYPIFRNYSREDAEANIKRVDRRMGEGQDLFRLYHGGNIEADEVFLDGVKSKHGDGFELKSLDFSGVHKWKHVVKTIEILSRYYPPILCESVSDRKDLEGQKEVRRRIDFPISEHVSSLNQAYEFAKHRYVDIYNISLCGAGGFTNAIHVAQVADSAGLSVLVGTTQELSVGVAAQATFGCITTNQDFPGDCTGGMLYENDVARNPIQYENGYVLLPDGPGLGIELDEDKVAAITEPLRSR
ncbi:TPA: muconate cycloisomerase [Candidatus Latescibacteria bacterium]|nr:muconate cycloisomerase [Candidatus Latescibacterota bacterium]